MSRSEQAGVSSTREPSGSPVTGRYQALKLPDILVVVFGTQISWNVSLSLQKRNWIFCFVPVLQGSPGALPPL